MLLRVELLLFKEKIVTYGKDYLVFVIQFGPTVQTVHLCGSILVVTTEIESHTVVVGCECMNCLELLGKYHVCDDR